MVTRISSFNKTWQVEKITFYADSTNYSNKPFSFKIDSYLKGYQILLRFHSLGNVIRASYIKGIIIDGVKFEPFQQSVNRKFVDCLNMNNSQNFAVFFLTLV